jgi:hypothetical protein
MKAEVVGGLAGYKIKSRMEMYYMDGWDAMRGCQ